MTLPVLTRSDQAILKVVTVVLLCTNAMLVKAQGIGLPASSPMAKDFEITIGFGMAEQAAYLGSDERSTRALPLVSAQWRNGWFAGIGGIGYRLTDDGPFSAGLKVSLDPGREESSAFALRGMGDTPMRAELGGFANYRITGPWSLGSSVRYGGGDTRDNLYVDFTLGGAIPLGGSHRIMASVKGTWANQSAMQTQFGVSSLQTLHTTYALYNPQGGLRDAALSIGYGYAIDPTTSLLFNVTAQSLQGDARNSPLTRSSESINSALLFNVRF